MGRYLLTSSRRPFTIHISWSAAVFQLDGISPRALTALYTRYVTDISVYPLILRISAIAPSGPSASFLGIQFTVSKISRYVSLKSPVAVILLQLGGPRYVSDLNICAK